MDTELRKPGHLKLYIGLRYMPLNLLCAKGRSQPPSIAEPCFPAGPERGMLLPAASSSLLVKWLWVKLKGRNKTCSLPSSLAGS